MFRCVVLCPRILLSCGVLCPDPKGGHLNIQVLSVEHTASLKVSISSLACVKENPVCGVIIFNPSSFIPLSPHLTLCQLWELFYDMVAKSFELQNSVLSKYISPQEV